MRAARGVSSTPMGTRSSARSFDPAPMGLMALPAPCQTWAVSKLLAAVGLLVRPIAEPVVEKIQRGGGRTDSRLSSRSQR